jgi:hypothetical protein
MQDELQSQAENTEKITRNIVEVFDRRTLIAIFLLFIGIALVAYGHSQAYGRRGSRTFEIKDSTRSPLATAIGFALVAMGGLLIGLRYCVLEKSKRKIVLLPGVLTAIALVLIFILGGPSGPPSKARPVPAELACWHKEVSLPVDPKEPKGISWRDLLKMLPRGFTVDSARWRFTTIDLQGCCRGEAEVEASWSGQKDLWGRLYGILVDAEGYEICRGSEEIHMQPKSRKRCQFSFGYDDQLTIERARKVKKMELRFEQRSY